MRFVNVLGLALLSASVAGHADTFNYSFNDTVNGTLVGAFTLTSPRLITTETGLLTTTCSEYVFGNYPCFAADIIPNAGQILLSINADEAEEIAGLPLSFFQVGVNTFGTDTLVIVDVPTSVSSVTPEPSSFLLLGTGLLCVAAVARRRIV